MLVGARRAVLSGRGAYPTYASDAHDPERVRPSQIAGVVLCCRALGRSYDQGRITALDGFDLDLRRGEIHGLIGPNGAGKTTVLRVVAGLATPTTGTAHLVVDGGRIAAGWRARHHVGVVPPGDRTFYLRLTAAQNLQVFARLHGLSTRDAGIRADEVIELVQLQDAAHRPISTYSEGMKKRLAEARALIGTPTVLLVDEATHDLDPEMAVTVRSLVRGLAERGTAVVWATQRIDELAGFADSATVLMAGRVRWAGTINQLRHAAPRGDLMVRHSAASSASLGTAAQALGPASRITGQTDGDGLARASIVDTADDVTLTQLIEALDDVGVIVDSCTPVAAPLERAYLSLVRGD